MMCVLNAFSIRIVTKEYACPIGNEKFTAGISLPQQWKESLTKGINYLEKSLSSGKKDDFPLSLAYLYISNRDIIRQMLW